MAARLNRRHQDSVRAKIQASQIINRLYDNLEGKVELSSGQIKSAEILLSKSIPSLQNVTLTGGEDDDGTALPVTINVELVKSAVS
jgi:hypothetical protein